MRVLVFGDSIAYGAWARNGGWVDMLKREMHRRVIDEGLQKVQVLNLGVGGHASGEILERVEAELHCRTNQKWPTILLFAFGANDARYPNDRTCQTQLGMFKENILKILTTAKKYTDKIYFILPTPVRTEEIVFSGKVYNNIEIDNFRNSLIEILTTHKIKWVDLSTEFVGNTDTYYYDDLHPNDIGHEVIYRAVKEMISGEIQHES